jgi:hypothetical protein
MGTKPSEAVKQTAAKTPTVNWDDSAMQTSYANVVNAFSTREEFTLLFGTNQTWSVGTENQVNIKLSDRLIMNPLVAKRLHALMGQLLGEYEARYGKLGLAAVDTNAAPKPKAAAPKKPAAAATDKIPASAVPSPAQPSAGKA